MRQSLRKLGRVISHGVLHTDDTPHQLAVGVAAGVFASFLPLVGGQMLLCVALAALLRGNKAVGLPFVWLSNPITFVPMYGAGLMVGRLVVPGRDVAVATNDVFAMLNRGHGLRELLTLRFWEEFLAWSISVGLELWVGCFLLGVAAAVPGYFIARRLITSVRARHRHYIEGRKVRTQRREQRRARLAKAAEPV